MNLEFAQIGVAIVGWAFLTYLGASFYFMGKQKKSKKKSS